MTAPGPPKGPRTETTVSHYDADGQLTKTVTTVITVITSQPQPDPGCYP